MSGQAGDQEPTQTPLRVKSLNLLVPGNPVIRPGTGVSAND